MDPLILDRRLDPENFAVLADRTEKKNQRKQKNIGKNLDPAREQKIS